MLRRIPMLFLLVLPLLVSSQGCMVRRIPPVRYIPLLGKGDDTSMEGILSRALKDKNILVRRDAVQALGTMVSTPDEQKRTASALGKALKDKEESIRMEAVRALGNISVDISGPYLSKAMKDESVRVRLQVVEVLNEAYRRTSGQVQGVTEG